jgi:hypothetical protein
VSGSVTLDAPAVSGTTTLTLPTTSGTVITTGSTFAGTGPAFAAYSNASQTLSSGTFTKVLFQVEEFDTNNNFASSTFTPTVAGYYQVNTLGYAIVSGGNVTRGITMLYKNGSVFQRLTDIATTTSNVLGAGNSIIVYMNGTTDYLEVYYWLTGSAGTLSVGSTTTDQTNRFSAALIRGA